MPCSTSSEPFPNMSEDEQTHLSVLLRIKLQAIPPFHIPFLTLSDVLYPTARASHIHNIPPDIQLPFFLRNRDAIDRYGGSPVKDEAKQSLKITRTIWFWRLDEARQFQRFHDTMRWNIAIYIALLTRHDLQTHPRHAKGKQIVSGTTNQGHHDTSTPVVKRIRIHAAASRFMKQYLAAVLEHHNTPLLFEARESFIRTWKNSAWDVYTVFRGAQRKLLRTLMKKLTKDWEEELDVAEKSMGNEGYFVSVGKFVGSLVPGRREQYTPIDTPKEEVTREGESGDVYMTGTCPRASCESQEVERAELLDALRAPFTPQTKKTKHYPRSESDELDGDMNIVMELRIAIDAVQTMRPHEMLPFLMHLFPAEGIRRAVA